MAEAVKTSEERKAKSGRMTGPERKVQIVQVIRPAPPPPPASSTATIF